MKLLFLGTRGDIDKRSRRHRRHSVLIVSEGGARILIDYGADWQGQAEMLRPGADPADARS